MKKYRVNVNGIAYEVEIEEITQEAAVAKAVSPAPTVTSAPAAVSSGSEKVSAPMPGNILSVNVKEGDVVKAGSVLMILEAMKMENEIMAPCDGKVAQVAVTAGQTVETGTLLCVIG